MGYLVNQGDANEDNFFIKTTLKAGLGGAKNGLLDSRAVKEVLGAISVGLDEEFAGIGGSET